MDFVQYGEYQIARSVLDAHVGPADPDLHAQCVAGVLADCDLHHQEKAQHVNLDGQSIVVVWRDDFWWVG